MKPQTLSAFISRAFFFKCVAILLVTTNTGLTQSFAQAPAYLPVNIRFLGMIDEEPAFEVAFKNPGGKLVVFNFRNAQGDLLHTEKRNEISISRKFRFGDPSAEYIELEVLAGKERQHFKIQRNQRVFEDIRVTRL